MSLKSRLTINRTTAKTAEDRIAEQSGDTANRLQLSAGVRVLIHLPSTDPALHEPIRYIEAHHAPFHICLRGDAIPKPDGTFHTSLNFDDCPRCKPVWEAWRAEGFTGTTWQEYEKHPKGPRRREIGEEKARTSGLAQVVDVTPFFTVEADNSVTPNPAMIALMDDFVRIMAGNEPMTPINKLPKEFVAAAKQGITYLAGAQTNFKRLAGVYAKHKAAFRKMYKLKDAEPLEYMDQSLLVLTITNVGEFKGNAKLEWSASYEDFTQSEDNGPTFALTDEFAALISERINNLHNPTVPPDAKPEDYNNVYAAMPHDMLVAYLAENKWSMPGAEAADDDDDYPVDEPEEKDRYGGPSDLSTVQIAQEPAPAAKELRQRLNSRKAATDDSSFE